MVSQRQPSQSPRSFKKIEEEAIDHALSGRWEEALAVNHEGLQTDPNNVGCHNRLAKAYLELSRYKDALASLKAALVIDPTNRVATRQMDRLSKLDGRGVARRTSGGSATNSALFISDPAVATVSELKKVAPPEVLAAISHGDKFKFDIDDAVVNVHTPGGERVGTLEVRIATRLRKMIAGGNKYEVLAAKLSDSEVVVIVRETKRSPEQARIASFPSYLQKKIGDFDIDDPMAINDEVRMEDDIDEQAPRPVEAEAMKSIMRGEFGGSADDASLKF
ncbi:MAG: tetratricopeptide repeat protein [Dehalococcoidia bacterium]|nr:tetratricopeptide repeat protein [Dehalococcoidia bacterium]